MLKTVSWQRKLLLGLVAFSLGLTALAIAPPAFANHTAGDWYIEQAGCGWCHSAVCPGGYGIWYYGYIRYWYDRNHNYLRTETGCYWTSCGYGRCE